MIHAHKKTWAGNWGFASVGARLPTPVYGHDIQFRHDPVSVGGRTLSSRVALYPVDWPGIRRHGPGHFYPLAQSRCGDLSRRLGRSHARLSRLNLCRAVTRRGSAKSNFIESGVGEPA